MNTSKFSVNSHPVDVIISWIKSDEIAIPEIQRPFVWDSSKVRDLVDSLYNGYPIGYLIAWKNPNINIKDGTTSEGKKILIDGQQRVMSLTTAILGTEIVDKDYRKRRIQIAFNPLEDRFEVVNPAILKNKYWIHDISDIINEKVSLFQFVKDYCSKDVDLNEDDIVKKIEKLKQITQRHVGLIELDHNLDIEVVTEIFIRINSQGVVLSQADFAMSKIASNDKYNGPILRKCIDYFCHSCVNREFINELKETDPEFSNSEYYPKMKWLSKLNSNMYIPDYNDILRVSFTAEFNRGKLSELVSLLSGRNFETRKYEEEIAEASFSNLNKGVLNFINETNFKKLIMIFKSAGFISSKMIKSQNVLNFAYILYLKLKNLNFAPEQIESYVRRWVVMSILTNRYSGSSETQIQSDITNITSKGIERVINNIEEAELSDAFWDVALIQELDAAISTNKFYQVFLASQIKSNNKGFLSREINVRDLVEQKGDIHHLFPKKYLQDKGFSRKEYNQIANYTFMQTEINIKIGKKPPIDYMADVLKQCEGGEVKLGGIDDTKSLRKNLRQNCIPEIIFDGDHTKYAEFIEQRKLLMAKRIKKYYKSL